MKTFSPSQYLFRYTMVSFIVYIVLLFSYLIVGYKEDSPIYVEVPRLALGIVPFLMLILAATRIAPRRLYAINALAAFVAVILIKYVYAYSGQDTFGPHVLDGYAYMRNCFLYCDLPFRSYLSALRQYYDISDMGFFMILYWVQKIYSDYNFVVYVIVALNVICLYITALYLHKMSIFLGAGESLAKYSTILFVSSSFLIFSMTTGLKEVIFVTIITMAVYYIILLRDYRTIKNILLALFFSYLTRYFRGALLYILLICIASQFLVKKSNFKTVAMIFIIFTLLSGIIIPYVVNNIIGGSYEAITATADHRMSQKSMSAPIVIQSWISALFGPFPNLERPGMLAFLYSFANFLKMSFSLMCLSGLYSIFKNKKIEYFVFIPFILSTFLMLVVAGVALDMRYHITYIPFFYIVATHFVQKKNFFNYSYLLVVVALVIVYSSRAL